MLQEGELLVASDVSKIIACRPTTTTFGAEWWAGQDNIGFGQSDLHGGKRIAQEHVAFDAVEHGVHQQQSRCASGTNSTPTNACLRWNSCACVDRSKRSSVRCLI